MVAKNKDRLTPIPRPAKPSARTGRQPARSGGAADDAPPDLSHIAPALRPLAVPVESIDFYPSNPNKHDEAQIKLLRAAMRTHGQLHPLLLNTAKSPPQVVAGNGRLQAALAENWRHIAAHGRPMTDQEAAAIIIEDKRIPELSPGWDFDGLKATMETAQVSDQDLADMIEALAEAESLIPKDETPAEPAAEEPPAAAPKITCPSCGHEWEAAA